MEKRRGILSLVMYIILLFLSALVLLSYIHASKQFGTKEVYKSSMAARDIALTIDTLYSYPYDATIYYEGNLEGLTVQVSGSKVTVFKLKAEVQKDDGKQYRNIDPTAAEHQFYSYNAENPIQIDSPKRMKLQKINGKLAMEKDEIL